MTSLIVALALLAGPEGPGAAGIAVQHEGRIRPLDTFARQLLDLVVRPSEVRNLRLPEILHQFRTGGSVRDERIPAIIPVPLGGEAILAAAGVAARIRRGAPGPSTGEMHDMPLAGEAPEP